LCPGSKEVGHPKNVLDTPNNHGVKRQVVGGPKKSQFTEEGKKSRQRNFSLVHD
jgi:hypothetical protein